MILAWYDMKPLAKLVQSMKNDYQSLKYHTINIY